MANNKQQKSLIIGISGVLLIALLGVLLTIKLNSVPKNLLTVSEKTLNLAENIQTIEKISKKHIIINKPDMDNQFINDTYNSIIEHMLESNDYSKSLVVDWNANSVFEQYLNFEITMTLDQSIVETENFVLNLDTLDKLDISSLFFGKTIEEYNIENNGELVFKETEINVADKVLTEETLPDAIKKDYGLIKPTPPPVVNKPGDKPDPTGGKKYVAFTFDDGPSKEFTNRIMNTADKFNAKVTFFTLGSQVEKFPDVAQSIVDRGHQLASHSYNHPDLTKISKEEQLYQINTTEDILRNTTGYKKEIMVRPPYGANDDTLLSNVPKTYMNWSNDPEDWKSRNPQAICTNIINDTKPGDIILLHDIYETTAEGFECGIQALADQGYEFITVEQLFEEYRVPTQNGNIYRRP